MIFLMLIALGDQTFMRTFGRTRDYPKWGGSSGALCRPGQKAMRIPFCWLQDKAVSLIN